MKDNNRDATTLQNCCPECAVPLMPQHRFCYNCGKRIHDSPKDIAGSATTIRFAHKAIAAPKPGELFADRFTVIKELGAGGMGIVFLIEEISSSLQLALKILKPEFTHDIAARSRFEREIRILARIRHPAIPRILEWGKYENSMFFITEFIHGKDLSELLRERGRLPPQEAISFIASIAEALGSAHQAGIIHRDLKPGNVMLANAGRIYLIDFGVARTVSAEFTQLTETGLFIGTPQYMAPEQLNSRYADERSDIYSLGIIFFELLTGRLPFSGDTPMAVASKHLNESPPSPRQVNPSIPYWIEQTILRCMAKDPSSRYWTVGELRTDLLKNRSKKQLRKRNLPNGDIITEDLSGRKSWALLISSDHEKIGWSSSAALYYNDSFFKLKRSRKPEGDSNRWEYLFDQWPENEILRRVVDYEAEAMMQGTGGSMFSKAKKWLGGQFSGKSTDAD